MIHGRPACRSKVAIYLHRGPLPPPAPLINTRIPARTRSPTPVSAIVPDCGSVAATTASIPARRFTHIVAGATTWSAKPPKVTTTSGCDSTTFGIVPSNVAQKIVAEAAKDKQGEEEE